MALNRLNQLYQAVIMDHASHPRNYGKLSRPHQHVELLNPTCGDILTVSYQLENDRIVEVKFFGSGCAISMASASIMTELLNGQTLDKAQELIEQFTHLIDGTSKNYEDSDNQIRHNLKDAYFLQGIQQFPTRYHCAILAWRALELGINKDITLEDGLTMKQENEEGDLDVRSTDS